jgi:integrase
MGEGTQKGTRARPLLTARGIAAMKPGEWATDPAARGAGVLQARKLGSGEVAYYYRYTGPNGERVRLPIASGIELAEARKISDNLSRRYQSGQRDLRAVIEAEEREAARRRRELEATDAAAAAKKRATLGALLTAYIAQLKRDGKPSADKVERALQRHVEKVWPLLWDSPAVDVTTDDLLNVVSRITDAGKPREAGKVRSYLSAAYAAGIRARQDARSLAALRALRVTSNPARDLVTVDGSSKARDRALSVAELRAYWRRIAVVPDPFGAMLRFHLLTGGQRVEQLRRLTEDDHDSDLRAVRLRDTKGRRKAAREHYVPLIPAAAAALEAMKGGELGPYLFTVTAGESGAVYATMQHRLREVVEAMEKAGELEKGPFTPGDLRRTVETRLAAAGIAKDVRAQLQSHGLGGVQDRHYDRHDYLPEKRAALEKLYQLVTGKAAKVTSIKRKAG